ncbi:MAG: cell division protein FtsZ [Bacteroidota bacterium]
MIKFDQPINQSSIIKVIGVGGGGSNAVSHMFKLGINGVDFIISNTDRQALEMSPVPTKIQLGASLTDGMGAGSLPEVGKNSAVETIEEIKKILSTNTKMVFITAGMGGGTGTGAAPVIASVARELGILTVGIVTIPFAFEGRKRRQQAEAGIEDLRQYVDTLLIISNDKLRELHGDLKLSEAFGRADDILSIAAKGIAEIITVIGYINVDFNDVNTVMRNSGVAVMGTGIADGENRAIHAVEMALTSPLLNDNDITGAQNILLYIASGGEEISMDEVAEITEYIQNAAGKTAEIIWGNGTDDTLGDKISVTIIATGFSARGELQYNGINVKPAKKIVHLDEETIVAKVTPVPQEDEMKLIIKETLDVTPAVTSETKAPEITQNQPVQNPEPQVKQSDIKFETPTPDSREPYLKKIEPAAHKNEEINNLFAPVREKLATEVSEEDAKLFSKARERMDVLRSLSMKLKTQPGLEEIEKKPAYQRRNITLTDNNPSSESEVSRYTLGEDDDKKPGLRSNSYLHDNVD